MSTWSLKSPVAFVLLLAAALSSRGEHPGRTTLTNPTIRCAVPETPYVVSRWGENEAVIVDKRAMDDETLPGHISGSIGVAGLRHENLFVPEVDGLNFEHIHDGTAQRRPILFVPRNAPTELRRAGGFAAELGISVAALTAPAVREAIQETEDAIRWTDIRTLGVEGQGWADTKGPFDRLPARAEGIVREPVWQLSRHSAGLCVRFVTDSPEIHARWTLTSDRLAMPHMPATGVSGLDLYARDDSGAWRWLAVGQPIEAGRSHTARLAGGLPEERREYLLYLPLYNGVSSVEVGVPEGNLIEPAGPRESGGSRPVVFYGTSITQGGCASRPGMVHTAILGRRLDVPVINLGFSGNGTMDLELGELLGELDAGVFVIDCLPNMGAEQVAARTEPLVRALRAARPGVPIVLAEDRTYANARFHAGSRRSQEASRAALRAAYKRLVDHGVEHLHYLPGESQLGPDGEDTVDGSHPTDLGYARMADAFHSVLEPLISRSSSRASP